MNALPLLAANDPSNPANAARQARAQTWVLSLVLSQEEIDKRLAGYVSEESKIGWKRGHELIVLAEYYLKTGDAQVLPSIEAMTVEVCNGQSLLGTFGHQFTNPVWNGQINGPYNIGYGCVNSAGLPGYFGLLLAKKCGISRPELDPAITRSTNFFSAYAGYGTIPYGEHVPDRSLHESNGKAGLAALAFSVNGTRPYAAEFYTKMAAAAASEREIGHNGAYFNYLWAPLGANVGGVEAAASHFSRIRWRLDLNRRWDGGFDYDCWYEGKTSGGPKYAIYDFWANTAMLLTYAMPLRQLTITGKNQDASLYLSSAEISETVFADDYNATTRTTPELVTDLGIWSPKVQDAAAKELGARTTEHAALIPQLIAIANDTNAGEQRVGACFALGKIGNGSAAADLAGLLTDSDEKVRWSSAYALRYLPATNQTAHLAAILAATASTARTFDPLNDPIPLQFAHTQLCYMLFNNGYSAGPLGIIRGNLIVGVDRNLLYPAIEAVAKAPLGGARATLQETFRNLTKADTEAVAGAIVDAVRYSPPSDKMFGNGTRMGGLEALQNYNFAEGVPLAAALANDINYGGGNHALDVLALYAGSSTLVNPDPGVIGTCDYLVYAQPAKALDAQEVLDAIAADTNPVAPTAFKSIVSVTAQNPNLQLPATFTNINVDAHDYAEGDSIYTWRKVHGAGQVTFAHNGTAAGKSTTALFDGTPGQYLFEVTMSDSRGLTEEVATVAVTLRDSAGGLPSNSAPTATAQNLTIPLSTTTPIVLDGIDPEGHDLNFTVTSGPTHGKLSGTAPHLTYTPDYGYTGTDSFVFEVMDSDGLTDMATVSLTVDPVGVLQTAVYEPFDYPVGELNGKSGATEVGLDGTWYAQAGKTTVAADSLTFGNLATAGNKFDTSTGANWGGARAISPSALAGSGLLNDGSTLWMSALVGYAPGANTTNAKIDLALANNRFHDWVSPKYIKAEGAQLGSGVGITMGRIDGINGRVVATQYRDLSQVVDYDASVYGSWEYWGAKVEQNDYKFFVCRITWASDPQQPDLIEVFQPLSAGLALPDKPVSTLSVVVNQSTFDTLAFNIGDKVILDEVRIGPNYQSILAGTETLTPDIAAPTPDPVAFSTPPTAVGNTSITMNAVPAYDPNGVEYDFTCTAGGGHDSGWQSGTSYTDSGLTPGVQYSYTVKARDLSPARNNTASSAAVSVTLPTTLTIPNVVGIPRTSAESFITMNHFSVGTITLVNDPVPAGAVISQSPAGGSAAASGTAVNMVVSLGPLNGAPTVDAGPNQTVALAPGTTLAAVATLNATVTDVGVDPCVTSWSLAGGPGPVIFADSSAVDTTATFTVLGSYVLRLTADDGTFQTSDYVTITVIKGNYLLAGFDGIQTQNTISPATVTSTTGVRELRQGFKQDNVAVGLANSRIWTDQATSKELQWTGSTQISTTTGNWGATDFTTNAQIGTGVYVVAQQNSSWINIEIKNNGTEDLNLNKFHISANRTGTGAPATLTVSLQQNGSFANPVVLSGKHLTDALGTSQAIALSGSTGWFNYEFPFSGMLTDTILASGETATFRIANPAGTARVYLDNIAISGNFGPVGLQNNAPVAYDVSAITGEEAAVPVMLVAADADPADTLAYSVLWLVRPTGCSAESPRT